MIDLISIYSDKAILAYNKEFDDISSRLMRIRVHGDLAGVDFRTIFKIKAVYDRIFNYHTNQSLNKSFYIEKGCAKSFPGYKPLSSVGIYIPGGSSTYISTMLMNAIPAYIAGVENIYIITPYHKIADKQLFMICAYICGIKYIYTFGGAQAIIALALGTKTIKKVDKITGPGNIYVTTAKRMMFGNVSIDNLAGPSEAIIIADQASNPQLVSIDLASQLEHDKSAFAILLTKTPAIAAKVRSNIMLLSHVSSKNDTVSRSWSVYGISVICKDSDSLHDLVALVSPEHLHINTLNPITISNYINTTGAVFLGKYTAIAFGDYVAGSNHILPTNSNAKFSSGLSVADFVIKKLIIHVSKWHSTRLLPNPYVKYMQLALIEGMELRALSIYYRIMSYNHTPCLLAKQA